MQVRKSSSCEEVLISGLQSWLKYAVGRLVSAGIGRSRRIPCHSLPQHSGVALSTTVCEV